MTSCSPSTRHISPGALAQVMGTKTRMKPFKDNLQYEPSAVKGLAVSSGSSDSRPAGNLDSGPPNAPPTEALILFVLRFGNYERVVGWSWEL